MYYKELLMKKPYKPIREEKNKSFPSQRRLESSPPFESEMLTETKMPTIRPLDIISL